MNISFLEKNGEEDKLILIFPGWSCGKEFHDKLQINGWHTAIVENYEDSGLDISVLEHYSTIYLFAWSLGVFMASITDLGGNVTAAFALNGTEIPAHDLHGIPYTIFKKTAETLTPRNLLKFRRRMSGSSKVFNEIFNQSFSENETNLLQQQLLSILKWQDEKKRFRLPWKKIFLSDDDAIFPAGNMHRFWHERKGDTNIDVIRLAGPHYIPLEQIIKTVIPDFDKVSKQFSGAKESYDRQAVAQQKLAKTLSNFLSDNGMKRGLSILEVGPGTGLFTKEIIRNFHPRTLDLVDISGVVPTVPNVPFSFFRADAEEWISQTEKRYDAVLSSATVQWFVNLKQFIRNVSEKLNENGIFGFSTFLPRNLEELDALRPSPLHYHSEKEIIEWMESFFDNINIVKSVFQLKFDSPSELLRHLRETGVAGSAPSGKLSLSKLRNIKTLTFHCACFTAVKKSQ